MWLWILVGVVVIIGLAVLALVIRYMGERGSVVIGGWIARAIDAYAKGSALHDAMGAALRPHALAAADSGARWAGIQRRADDLAQELSTLRDTAEDRDDRADAAKALESLQAACSAMQEAVDAAGAAGQAEVARGRLAVFEEALRALRSPDPHLW
jgi:hypothetical protein